MIASSPFLRRALAADAITSGAMGVLLAAAGGVLEGLLGIPAAFSHPVGLFLVAYAAFIAWMAVKPSLPGRLVWAVIVVNGLWVIESIVALAAGFLQPTALGYAFVIAQALAVAAFAELQVMGLRRSQRLAA